MTLQQKKASIFSMAQKTLVFAASGKKNGSTFSPHKQKGNARVECMPFRRWATERDINKHTLGLLSQEYYDSFATIATLTTDAIETLVDDVEQRGNLRRAVESLNPDVSPKVVQVVRQCASQTTLLEKFYKDDGRTRNRVPLTEINFNNRSNSICLAAKMETVTEAETSFQNQAASVFRVTEPMTCSRLLKTECPNTEGQQGTDNPYFCYDDGSITPCTLVAKFGRKGRQPGELGDAHSIAVTNAIADCVLLVCDTTNHRLQSFRANGSAGDAITIDKYNDPWSVVHVDEQRKTFAVSFKRPGCVAVISSDGIVKRYYKHKCPHGMAMLGFDRLLVSDIFVNDVFVHDLSMSSEDDNRGPWSLRGVNPNIEFNQPKYLTVSPLRKIVVSDTGNHCVKIFSETGIFEQQFGSYGKGLSQFKFPHGVCCDRFGHIIVADHYNNRLSLFGPDGEFIRHMATECQGLKRPKGLTLSREHKLFVTHGALKGTEILVFDLSIPDCEV